MSVQHCIANPFCAFEDISGWTEQFCHLQRMALKNITIEMILLSATTLSCHTDGVGCPHNTKHKPCWNKVRLRKIYWVSLSVTAGHFLTLPPSVGLSPSTGSHKGSQSESCVLSDVTVGHLMCQLVSKVSYLRKTLLKLWPKYLTRRSLLQTVLSVLYRINRYIILGFPWLWRLSIIIPLIVPLNLCTLYLALVAEIERVSPARHCVCSTFWSVESPVRREVCISFFSLIDSLCIPVVLLAQ